MYIKNYPNYMIDKFGVVTNINTGHALTPIIRNGYFAVRLSKNGKVKERMIHHLVYETFKGKRKVGMHIDHIDCVRTNNNLNNLRMVSPAVNLSNMKLKTKGEDVNTAKLSEQDVIDIRIRKSKGERTLDIAKEYNVIKSTINRIINGKTWKHLPLYPVDNSYWGNPKITGSISGKNLREKYGNEYHKMITKGNKFKKHCLTCKCNAAIAPVRQVWL